MRLVRLRWWALALIAVVGAAGVGTYFLVGSGIPSPPEVDVPGDDPELADAVTAARRAVEADPRSADTWGRLGLILAAHRYSEAALTCFEMAEKLDPAILDRPSRFDRKYRFDLPALPERLAYIKHWNRTLRIEMRLTDSEAVAVAERSDRFSFAYMKELFLSAMMEWIGDQTSGRTSASMGEALVERAALLREQLSDGKGPQPTFVINTRTMERG